MITAVFRSLIMLSLFTITSEVSKERKNVSVRAKTGTGKLSE